MLLRTALAVVLLCFVSNGVAQRVMPGDFKITVLQQNPSERITDFVLYFPSAFPSGVPIIWGVGSLSKAPATFTTTLHQFYFGLSASITDSEYDVYSDGPVYGLNQTYWFAFPMSKVLH